MNIRNKRGFALALAIYFVIISMITSVAMYTYAFHVARESGIQEPASIKNYYAALGAARYVYVLLSDPVTNLGFTSVEHSGESVTYTIEPGSSIGTDLEIPGNSRITVVIEEFDPNRTGEPITIAGNTWVNGTYRMTVTMSS